MSASPRHKKVNTIMIWLFWIMVCYFLYFLFDEIFEQRMNPNQQVHSSQTGAMTQVILERNAAGHYVASGYINNQPVTFLLDTGASSVAIPEEIAEELQLEKGLRQRYHTANGTTTGYLTFLDQVKLGDIQLSDIKGGIVSNMRGDFVLLGMSFLKHLEFTQRGDTLILRQYN